MQRALARLAQLGRDTVRLEADPPGVPLYLKLAFVAETESLRFARPAGGAGNSAGGRGGRPPGAAARVAAGGLPADVADYDAARFGDGRTAMLTRLSGVARDTFVVADGGALRGYALMLPSRFGLRIGPWVADDAPAAARLLDAVLAAWGHATLLVGVPAWNPAAAELLRGRGFAETAGCLRMVRWPRAAQGAPERVWGIAQGATG